MARTINEEQRKKNEAAILNKSREVFCAKGFNHVTMKDLVEASGMSRGGFYFYYSSVDVVFRAATQQRTKSKFEEIVHSIEENPDFDELLETYFKAQKKRLLNMDQSMIRAMYEYLFTHRDKSDIEFRDAQIAKILDTIRAILELGVRQGKVDAAGLDQKIENIMICIEGFNALAMFESISEERIDAQFQLLTEMIRG